MLPNFDQKVTFGEIKIKGLGREEEGEQGRKRESIVGCQPHWPRYKKGRRLCLPYPVSSPISTAKAP